jgi:hypothetical protein
VANLWALTRQPSGLPATMAQRAVRRGQRVIADSSGALSLRRAALRPGSVRHQESSALRRMARPAQSR